MTDPWAEFLAARLDEDEAAAKAALADIAGWGGSWEAFSDDIWKRSVIEADGMADHLQRHGPARALRQVAATRALLAAYEASVRSVGPALSVSLLRLVQAAAEVWSGHPGYAPLTAATSNKTAG